IGDGITPGWLAGAVSAGAAGTTAATGRTAGAAGAGAATGTGTVAVSERATRMRRSPFSTSISVRSVSASRVASSRTSSGSKGLALAMHRSLAIGGFREADGGQREQVGGAADGGSGVLLDKSLDGRKG